MYLIYRDSLLATLLDSVRSSGNHHVHVKLSATPRDKRLIPFNVSPDQEVKYLIRFYLPYLIFYNANTFYFID